ncbi:SusC/RagA family TonB-linked outer membrane protein [Bacteroidia bacterium]|nr:SusC/RagA family TonB-linked outer membrane protein [Bacteroidia bacterium]
MISINAFAQESVTVTGNVKDAGGEPIIGGSVLVKGTTIGTVTDFDGNFTLTVPKGSTLSISYIGYKAQEITFTGQKQLIVVLQDDTELLDEVVVIGYGSVRKNDLTGSVTAIKPDAMNRGLTTTATDMISGKIAGVNVTTDGGAPGGGATIRIRGGASLSASNNPLIVIDGFAIDNEGIKGVSNPLSTINPNDIETFTVLKDASATAIYGSRASNGVILITTKKGEKGARPRISYDGNVSVSTKINQIEVMNAGEYRNFITGTFGAESGAAKLLGNANTDWQKEIFRTGIGTDHNVSVTGGLSNMPYRVSVGYTNQNGILQTSKFERYTAAFNLNPSLFDNHLNMNLNAKGMIAKNRFADTEAIGAALSFDPTQPVMDGNPKYGGYFAWEDQTSKEFISIATKNPVAMLKQKQDEATSKNLVGNAQFDYKFHGLPDLRANLNVGMDLATGTQDTYYPKESPIGYIDNGRTGFETIDKYNLLLDFYLQYSKDINDHHFDVMGGYSWQHFHRTTENAYNNIPGNNPTSYVFKTESFLVSFFGRANYSFKNKYLVTATVRYDGTSRFSSDNRWGLFPSVALGWRIKEEGFMQDVEDISDLKLRLGYGITGQQDILQGDYPYMPTYFAGQDGAYYQFGDNKQVPIARPNGYNKDLKWEETTTYNAGIDFGFLNNRITSSIDYYYRDTKDLINVIDVPAGTNFKNRIVSNIGSMKNQGVEFAINAKAITTKNLLWDLGFNAAWSESTIKKLTAQDNDATFIPTGTISGGTGTMIQAQGVGHSINSFYVFQQVYDSKGKPIEGLYVDRNGDGQITDADRYFYKKPAPDFILGVTSKLVYKAWDFSFSLRGNFNNYVYNNVASANAPLDEGFINNKGFLSNRPSSAFETNFMLMQHQSDYYVQNASFLRCDNITLGYTFKNLFNTVNGRIYATAQNPFVITKYEGLDPEVGTIQQSSSIDKNVYPRPLVSLIGLSLTF